MNFTGKLEGLREMTQQILREEIKKQVKYAVERM